MRRETKIHDAVCQRLQRRTYLGPNFIDVIQAFAQWLERMTDGLGRAEESQNLPRVRPESDRGQPDGVDERDKIRRSRNAYVVASAHQFSPDCGGGLHVTASPIARQGEPHQRDAAELPRNG